MSKWYPKYPKGKIADYETSEMLKKLGFKEECREAYIDVQDKRFRDENGRLCSISFAITSYGEYPVMETGNFNKHADRVSAPLWWQVKCWLWKKHNVTLECSYEKELKAFVCGGWKNDNELTTFKTKSKSPVESEIKAIQQTIEYLHKQLLNKK
jgi:hypothetical protein